MTCDFFSSRPEEFEFIKRDDIHDTPIVPVARTGLYARIYAFILPRSCSDGDFDAYTDRGKEWPWWTASMWNKVPKEIDGMQENGTFLGCTSKWVVTMGATPPWLVAHKRPPLSGGGSSNAVPLPSRSCDRSPFLDLPRKLRDMVYDQSFDLTHNINKALTNTEGRARGEYLRHIPTILLVRRQLYKEGRMTLTKKRLSVNKHLTD